MKKTIMCFGDSNTWGANPLGGRHDDKTRWTALLADKLGHDDYIVYEEGINGRTTVFDDFFNPCRNGKDGLKYALFTNKPLDFVIIMLGTNDCNTMYNAIPDNITRGMEVLVNMTKTFGRDGDDPKVLIVSPIHIGDNILETSFALKFGLQGRDKSYELASRYEKLAKNMGVYYLDASKYGEPSKEDGLHMLAPSHKKIADAMYDKVKEILG